MATKYIDATPRPAPRARLGRAPLRTSWPSATWSVNRSAMSCAERGRHATEDCGGVAGDPVRCVDDARTPIPTALTHRSPDGPRPAPPRGRRCRRPPRPRRARRRSADAPPAPAPSAATSPALIEVPPTSRATTTSAAAGGPRARTSSARRPSGSSRWPRRDHCGRVRAATILDPAAAESRRRPRPVLSGPGRAQGDDGPGDPLGLRGWVWDGGRQLATDATARRSPRMLTSTPNADAVVELPRSRVGELDDDSSLDLERWRSRTSAATPASRLDVVGDAVVILSRTASTRQAAMTTVRWGSSSPTGCWRSSRTMPSSAGWPGSGGGVRQPGDGRHLRRAARRAGQRRRRLFGDHDGLEDEADALAEALFNVIRWTAGSGDASGYSGRSPRWAGSSSRSANVAAALADAATRMTTIRTRWRS